MAPHFWSYFESKRRDASIKIRQQMNETGAVAPEVVAWTETTYGSYAARIWLDVISRWRLDKPAQLEIYVDRALATKNDPHATLRDVESLCEDMSTSGVAERLP